MFGSEAAADWAAVGIKQVFASLEFSLMLSTVIGIRFTALNRTNGMIV